MKLLKRFWRRRQRPPGKIQFFVVGTGRCGTTLLRDVLRLHPEVYVPASESHWIPYQHEVCGSQPHAPTVHAGLVERFSFPNGELKADVMAADIGRTRAELFAAAGAALARETATVVEWNDALYSVLGAARGRSVLGDKTPCYCLHMPLLQQLWPDAKFLHIIRDGRDVALSMSRHTGFQRMVSLQSASWGPLALDRGHAVSDRLGRSPSLEDYLGLWAVRLRRALDDAPRLRPGSYLEVRYEALIEDPGAETRRLARFLDVSRPPDWLRQVAAMMNRGNTNKIGDPALWRALTAASRETLAELDYLT
ncbi:MAG TPA: sulfotransferase [Thermoanaerobaculia bacterium]|nr:sulfotransferase [Thermoanaerobaculia bacterium]